MIDARPADRRPLLEVDGADVVRDGRYLLRSISMTVQAGQHWALFGANGAGKSTLLGLLGAVSHPTRGTVRVRGRTLGRVDVRELRSYLGHVNPCHEVASPLRVAEVVLTGVTNTIQLAPRWTPTAAQRDRAQRLLTMLGIAAQADARWPTLSQGERARALIARALMPYPRLLLLDEPASGLDLAAWEQLLISLDMLRREHPELATVLVTHHLEELPASTTHALLLRRGECVAAGDVAEVLTSELVSDCFAHPVRITRDCGRWVAHATSWAGRAPARQ